LVSEADAPRVPDVPVAKSRSLDDSCAARLVFLSSPPRAALHDSSSARRIFKDTRAVPLPSDPRVVVRLGESRSSWLKVVVRSR